ncbi:MAG TPA: phosphotransferase [Terracidiphilus sp.]
MASTAGGHDARLAAAVLAKHWRIREPVFRTDFGVSRATWRVGQWYWLSQSEESRYAELIRQAQLMQRLRCFLEHERLSISVPEAIASLNGQLVVEDGGYGWCLSRHLHGFHPESSDPAIYPILAEGLARFHGAMRLFSDRQAMESPDGISVNTRKNIARMDTAKFVPFTKYAEEQELLVRAGDWLLPRLQEFEDLPRQLIHGDWTPRNVLFDSSGDKVHLNAVLDFEAMAFDPVHVDVASTCSTLLMWSGLGSVDERIGKLLSAYEGLSGRRLERDHVFTATVAHWLCLYWSWRDRLMNGGFGQEVKERLCLRIASVLDYVSRSRDSR